MIAMRHTLTERRVIHCLSTFGPQTEAAISHTIWKYSAPTTTSAAMRRLRKQGLIVDAGNGKSPWGKRARLWRLATKEERETDASHQR